MWLNYCNSITSQVWIIDIQQPWLSKNFVYGKWREHLRTPVPLLDGGEILAFLFTLSADDAVLRRGQPLLDNKAGGLNIQLQLEKPKRGLDGLNAESMFSWDLPLISQDTSTSWMLKQHGVACRPAPLGVALKNGGSCRLCRTNSCIAWNTTENNSVTWYALTNWSAKRIIDVWGCVFLQGGMLSTMLWVIF